MMSLTMVTGGHTTEALTLVSALDFSRYTPRIYIVSEGDSLSAEKAAALEAQKTSSNKVCHYTLND
jgi:beta-1,4-N-acetylglucosaminyltransferase